MSNDDIQQLRRMGWSAEQIAGAGGTVKERPILFSLPMVLAILDGRKTQTRRPVKPQIPADAREVAFWWHGALPEETSAPAGVYYSIPSGLRSQPCPYGKPGDRLWVRETWARSSDYDGQVLLGTDCRVLYRADDGIQPSRWRPSIFMPRWASRITLEITGVRVERLQQIRETDAVAEGYQATQNARGEGSTARDWFWHLWDSINGERYPWSSDPWVWVIEFRKLENHGGVA